MDVNGEVIVWEKIIKSSLDIICAIDPDGCIISINDAVSAMLGYNKQELLGHNLSDFVHPDDLPSTFSAIGEVLKGIRVRNFENRYLHKNGYEVFLLWSGIWSEEDNAIICVGRDITEQKLARHKEELYQALLEHGGDMLALLDANLTYIYSGGAISKQLGYSHDQLVGTSAYAYIHPEDAAQIGEILSVGLATPGHVTSATFRFKDVEGEWRWIESTLSNQLHNPAVRALVATSRDVTEKISSQLRLEESQQRFKSLFDNNLDMVFFKNRAGMIVDANPAARTFFGLPKEQVPDQPISKWLAPDLLAFSDQAFQSALKGEWVRFNASVTLGEKGTFAFDVSKVPVVVKGEIIGVYTILKDITEIHHSSNIIKQQAEKLNVIIESIADAFFMLDKNWNFVFVNDELERLFGIDRNELLGRSFWESELGMNWQELEKQYYGAVETGRAVRFDYYIDRFSRWLQVKAFPSAEGLAVFMSDVTESVKAKQELEKLSLVASKTTNGVVITDAAGAIEWVNEGFTSITGYTLAEVAGKVPASFLVGEETDSEMFRQFQEKRFKGKPFQAELLNYKKSGEKIWMLLDVTPVFNEAGEVVRYITIQTDITDRKEAEASQLQLTKDLDRQNKDLQQFTYIVSHNLRAPVANAMGLVDLLGMVDKDSETFGVSVGYLKKSVHQLDTVLRDLNKILSIRDRREALDGERIPLLLVCRQAVEDLHTSLTACGGEVLLEMDESLKIHGDKAYLYSVMHNLLTNAIKYRSPQRGLKVKIKCISNTESGKIISFSDNGSGFDMQLAGDKIFKLYKRFHAGSDGRGLGLFLVKAHLNAMGGHIEVTSQVNIGTRFLIYFK